MQEKYTMIIAEKPNAAKKIAQALSEGKFETKKTEEGVPYYIFTRKGKKHLVVCAAGHLFNLDAKNSRWIYPVFEYEWKPSFSVRKSAEFSKKYYTAIKKLSSYADEVIVATDYDTEGEVIGYNIVRFILGRKDAKRMKFSTLTKDELITSYEKASYHLDFNQLEAGMARHEVDWLWGINLTRALTLSLKNDGVKAFSIISTGRVQGPTLALLAKREEEIKKFKPKPFWELHATVVIKGKKFDAYFEKGRLWKKDETEKLLKKLKVKKGKIVAIKRRKYKQNPPVPFNTTDLQSEAYAQFKFSPRQTLNIAESLYQSGYISYPRSASQKLPPSINYKKILKALSSFSQYKRFIEKILSSKEIKPNEGKKEDPAHPAIYPTHEVPDPSKLTPQQRKLYDLIVRRTLATFGEPAERESVKVYIEINGERFILEGKKTIKPGWTEIYKPYLSMKEQLLPDIKEGEEVKVSKVESIEKETQPPARYSQGSIIKEMESRGLGTRATRAQILQTLYDRKYIVGKSIQVTALGEKVIKTLKKFSPKVISEDLTRKLEEEMELISSKKKTRKEVVEEAKKILEEILKDFKKNEKKIGKELSDAIIRAREASRILGPCPNCKDGYLKIMRGRSGKLFAGCSNYPKCKQAYPLPQHAKIEATGRICPHCHTPIIKVIRKGKRPFTMCLDPNCPTKKDWGKKNGNSSKKVLSKRSKKSS